MERFRGKGVISWFKATLFRSPSCILLMVWVVVFLLSSWGGNLPEALMNQVTVVSPAVDEDIVAGVGFRYEDPEFEEKEREKVREEIRPIYELNTDFGLKERICRTVKFIANARIASYTTDAEILKGAADAGADRSLAVSLGRLIRNRRLRFHNPDEMSAEFSTEIAAKFFNPYEPAIEGKWPSGTRFVFVTLREKSFAPTMKPEEISDFQLKIGLTSDESVPAMKRAFKNFLAKYLDNAAEDDMEAFVKQFITCIPVVRFLDKETGKLINEEVRARMTYNRGQVLVPAGSPIDSATIRLLRFHAEKLREQETWFEVFRRYAGNAGNVGVILLMFALWLARSAPDMVEETRRWFLFALLVLVVLVIARWIYINPEISLQAGRISIFVVPIIPLALVGTLVFNERVSMAVVLMVSALIMLVTGMDTRVFMVHAGGGMVAAVMASNIRDRLKLLTIGVIAGFVQVVLVGLAFLNLFAPSRPEIFHRVLAHGASCWVSSFFSAVIITGLLPLIEALFGILTNIRLYELSDASHPAQKKIAIEAPGTYTHTLSVMTLAEAGAEAIGADALLTKAGTLYHDLGKTIRPEYFVENMKDATLRHAKLSPQISTLIIINHVKDGIEMAREYGLPKQIIKFIPEHHGTTCIEYFYHKALENAPDPDTVREDFFRYPGPKPQSKETAIVMIADTLEAASRTLEDPTSGSLRKMVHGLILKKLHNGQFDECNLTFRDIKILEDTFVNLLVARYHSRIKYPDQEKKSGREEAGKKGKPKTARAAAGNYDSYVTLPSSMRRGSRAHIHRKNGDKEPEPENGEAGSEKATEQNDKITEKTDASASGRETPGAEEPSAVKSSAAGTGNAEKEKPPTLDKQADNETLPPVYLELRIDSGEAPAISRAGWNRLFTTALPHAVHLPEIKQDISMESPESDNADKDKKGLEVHVLVTDDEQIAKLNKEYLGHDGSTDVLAFEQGETDPETGRCIVGQIVVSCQTARREAASRSMDVEEELRRYALHGWLHLLGFHDETEEDRVNTLNLQETLLKTDHEKNGAADREND